MRDGTFGLDRREIFWRTLYLVRPRLRVREDGEDALLSVLLTRQMLFGASCLVAG